MRRALSVLSALATIAVLPSVATSAAAAPTGTAGGDARSGVVRADDRPTPASTRQNALRQSAVEDLVAGDARLQGRGRSRTILTADGSKVSYPTTQHARLLTFLVDFGDGEGNPDFPDQTAGPVHDRLPPPAPSDNSTYWKPSFDEQHYEDMFFNGMADQDGQSFKDLYTEMSSGRFGLSGDVSDWVSVDHPSSYYSQANGEESGHDMANFIGDSASAWFAEATSTMTPAEVHDYLASFDEWDRYDSDNDGVFNEPDGYIDHFQAIHAGVGEEAGGAPWTIWSHRSGAALDPTFSTGPDCVSANPGLDCFLPGGVEIGDTGYWIFDYTTEPENGGLGVFAHEFAHDLGLPDYYDTESSTTDNSVGFWNLMSAGSWLSNEGHATGTTPNHVGAYDKLFLGWYGAPGPANDDLEVVDGLADEPATVTLGPSYHATTTGKQAVIVDLPDGEETVDGPATGSDDGAYLYSGNTSQTQALATSPEIDVPDVASPTLTAKVAYDTEPGFDYVYLWVYDVAADEWSASPIETSESTDADSEANLGNGITGSSGGWVDLTADLSAYAGRTVRLQWEYLTDQGTLGDVGFALDEIALGDYGTGFDEDQVGWQLDGGFAAVRNDEYDISYRQYYILENRQYAGYDDTLTAGPYSWGHNVSAEPYTVSDRFPYQDGLLVWYVNGRYGDNNTSEHPGGGVTLPVDAAAAAQAWVDGDGDPVALVDSRVQGFDATFDVDETDALDLGMELDPSTTGSLEVPAGPSNPVFDDSDVDGYYDPSLPGSDRLGTRVAGAGAMVQVVSSDEATGQMVVRIGKRFVASTSRPEIDGTPQVERTLTAVAPTWFQDDVDTQVAWLRDGEPIDGADDLTYQLGPADAGAGIRVAFTGSKDGYTATTAVSAAVSVAPGPASTTTSAVGILGTATVGSTLGAQGAGWSRAGTSTFAWAVGGSPAGTGPTYDVKPGDLGKVVTLTETRRTVGYLDATDTASTGPVAPGAAPSPNRAPAITGTARVGSTLTVTGAAWPRAGASTFAWTVGGSQVATGTTYQVRPADLGKTVSVTETFTSPGYPPGTASATSGTVGKAPVTLTLKHGPARKNKKVRLTVRATSPDLRVSGRVRITYDVEPVDTLTLKSGEVSIRLPKRGKGSHELKVTYLPARGFGPASHTVDVTVR
ncbi:immune inhibitor A [Nocardioides sp. CGMCC 1.13656]|nr:MULTISPECIES: immune inhibitor A domain-containing protein [unclassified Nocardioides]MBA2955831.1 immune inhibitor A [Nocardioides sp. CGMCC 1.13656]